ncbi:MAG: aminoacyl-tRNA deacylase [Candidatus Heimdallarchaeota archaeon]
MNQIKAEHLRFEQSIHTVKQCVAVTGFPIEEITKCVVMSHAGKCVVGLVPAKYRVSTSRVAKLLGITNLDVANAEVVLKLTGYPVGGIPFVGYPAIRLVDKKIFQLDYIYSGGGSDSSLLKLWVSEIKKMEPQVARIRK